MTPLPARRRRGPLAAFAVLLILPIFAASTAQAQDAYRYWTYWWGQDGAWTYASSGPDDRVVVDGDVEGWLFQASAEATPSTKPGELPDFGALCTGPAEAGKVRVGVVIDYGTSADTPEGSEIPEGQNPQTNCAIVPEGSTGSQVLSSITEVRAEGGAVCGITQYPATGCFETVAAGESAPSPSAAAAADGESDTTTAGWMLMGILIVLIIAVFTRMALNRRKAGQPKP